MSGNTPPPQYQPPMLPPYAQVTQAESEYQEAQRKAAEAIRDAQEQAEKQRRAQEQAAADQAGRMRWTNQPR
jgi:hypothetical protein